MKKLICLIVVALAAVPGCLEFLLVPGGRPASRVAVPRPSGPVSADQVNETNAFEKAEELRRELDKDSQSGQPAHAGSAAQSPR